MPEDVRSQQIVASSSPEILQRYARNMGTFSSRDQIILLGSRVCIVGLGGLGGTVIEILTRLGIGAITLVDGDVFEASNLNRQLLCTMETLGAPKVRAAANRVRQINPSVRVRIHGEFLDAQNAVMLIEGADVVVDCLDNLKSRFVLEKAAKAVGIPLVSAAIAGTYGQITTIFPEDPGFVLIYGSEDQVPVIGAEASLGTLPYTAMMLASLECSEITKILLKRGNLLRNRLLVTDLMDNVVDVLDLAG